MDKRLRYIYEITNTLNGKTYIGQHTVRIGRTISSDTYWGSGKIIKEAISKYGIANFKKNIIISGEFTKAEINLLEISEISKQRKMGKAEYNISDGGESPFINSEFAKSAGSKADPKKHSEGLIRMWHNMDPVIKRDRIEKRKATLSKNGYTYKTKGTTGFKFSEEAKMRMSENRLGERNGSYGTHWYTDGSKNIRSKECPMGFHLGRV